MFANVHAGARRVPRLALRRAAAEHPMAMFVSLSTIALSTMAFSSLHTEAPTRTPVAKGYYGEADAKTARLPRQLESSISVCEGDAWGVESRECLRAIAKASGQPIDPEIQVIAAAKIDHTRPNYF